MNESWTTRPSTTYYTVTVFTRGILRARWYWHVEAPNGEIVAQSEAYSRRIDAMSTAERLFPRVEDQ